MGQTFSRRSFEPAVLWLGADTEADVLIGSRCPKCLSTFFPPREWCGVCLEPITKQIELSREGTLGSFTLVEMNQEYSIVPSPYVVGEVLLPEGIPIYTTINLKSELTPEGVKLWSALDNDCMKSLRVGQKAKLSPVVIRKEGEDSIVAYNFDVEVS
ncbi:Zn-ribbon domain-containing OB-fold protein [Chloroflexota bacterium]